MVPCFALPPSSLIPHSRGVKTPLRASWGARQEVFPPLECKHSVESDFWRWNHKVIIYQNSVITYRNRVIISRNRIIICWNSVIIYQKWICICQHRIILYQHRIIFYQNKVTFLRTKFSVIGNKSICLLKTEAVSVKISQPAFWCKKPEAVFKRNLKPVVGKSHGIW